MMHIAQFRREARCICDSAAGWRRNWSGNNVSACNGYSGHSMGIISYFIHI